MLAGTWVYLWNWNVLQEQMFSKIILSWLQTWEWKTPLFSLESYLLLSSLRDCIYQHFSHSMKHDASFEKYEVGG